MYEPDSSVLRPVTWPTLIRGSTIQNCEPSRASPAAGLCSWALTLTCCRLLSSSTDCTLPTSTPR
jgi:hypothetical protein